MKITPTNVINTVLTIVLLSSILFIGLTSSVGVYDPYADYDADGDIDIFDVVPMADAYGTTGDPTRNVTVTNWPPALDDCSYSYFSYRFKFDPVVYVSPVDSVTHGTNSTLETTVADYTINGKAFLSGLSLEPWFNFRCDVKTESGHPEVDLTLYIYVNGELQIQDDWTTQGAWQNADFRFEVDENRTDNVVRVGFNSSISGVYVWIRYMRYDVQHRYQKTELTPQDFGSSRAYISSIKFGTVEDIIVLDHAVNQTIIRVVTGTDTVEFKEKLWFDHIEIIRGYPIIEVYAEDCSS